MKKLFCAGAALLLVLVLAASALAEAKWDYPVPLKDIKSEYALLVNEDHMLDKTFSPSPLVKVTGIKRATSAAVQMQETAANALKEMFAAASLVTEYTYTTAKGEEKTAQFSEGMTLYLKSGYRSYSTQKTTYANHLEKNNNVDDGYVAKPGASEHQTGLCADVLNADYAGRPLMTQDFEFTAEAQWMKEHCAEFGFILRYPDKASEEYTKISYEPWHFRYVGLNAASYIMEEGLTLEQFMDEALQAVADYENAGGDAEAQLQFELLHENRLPDFAVLDEVGDDGDSEISLDY